MGKLLMLIGLGVMTVLMFAVVSIVAAIPTFFLWNWLMPEIFGLKAVTIWQAWGLNFLAAILFKGSVSASPR